MLKNLSFILFSFFIAACSIKGNVQGFPQDVAQSCHNSFIDGSSVSWCVESEAGKTSDQVVYYFHGIMDDEHRWYKTDIRPALYNVAALKGKTLPVVVSISLGKVWFLTEERRYLGVLDSNIKLMAESIIPQIENELGVKGSRRIVVGESMGGFNAFQMAAHYPSMWSKAVMLCPAFTPVGPHSSPLAIAEYLQRNPHADAKRLLSVFPLVLLDFPTNEVWIRNNPILISKNLNAFPVSLIASNGWDHYGFNEGALTVATNIHQQGLTVQYETSPESGHCVHNQDVLQKFSNFILSN